MDHLNFQLEDHHREQYFFTEDTAKQLATLTVGHNNVCCLCTPTVYYKSANPKKTLMDIDPRVLQNVSGAVQFDLTQSIFRQFINGEWYNYYNFLNNFDCILIDPPFDLISLDTIANQMQFLTNFQKPDTVIYMVHQLTRFPIIEDIFGRICGLKVGIQEDINLVYANPNIRQLHSRRPVVLYNMRPAY